MAPQRPSRNQLDKAGSRVRRAARERVEVPDSVLRTIDDFRAWHLPTLQEVQRRISGFFHEQTGLGAENLPVTSRLKTPSAITAKLVRTETSLVRMQDIVGARIVVPNLDMQNASLAVVEGALFANCVQHVKDQRQEPDQYGYRAIHVIIQLEGRIAEIQIRTRWQDAWAQIVESLDSSLGKDLKHGRGPAEWLEWLHAVSDEYRKADLGRPYVTPPLPFDEVEEAQE